LASAEEIAMPDGWAVATIDQLSTHITSGSRDWKQYYDKGSGVFILAQNVRPLKLELASVQNVDPPHDDRDAVRSIVFQNDILITIVGANTGDVCRVPSALDRHFVCQSVALIRPSASRYARFLELFLNAEGGGKSQMAKHIYGAGRPHLSFDQIRELVITFPPISELAEIESRVDEIFSDIDAVEKTIDEQERSARALKQSILKAAFEGRLVPQDAADEPATKLLERIRKEKGK
jgi:type I restriction enzyme S subunit